MSKFSNRFIFFYKNLLFYIIILCLPLIVLSYTFYNLYLKEFTQSVYERRYATIETIRDSIDTQIKQIENISYQMQKSKTFQDSLLSSSFLPYIDVIHWLQALRISDQLVTDIAFYPQKNEYIITSNTSSSLAMYFEGVRKYTKKTEQDFINALNTDCPIWWGTEPAIVNNIELSYITAFYPLMISQNINYNATVVFTFNEEYFRKSVNSVISSPKSDFLILDKNNQIIFRFRKDSDISLEQVLQIRNLSDNRLDKYWNGVLYNVILTQSKQNDWVYISLEEKKTVTKQLDKLQNIYINTIILVMLAGGLFSYLFTQINYKPIKQLGRFLQSSLGLTIGNKSEVEAAKDTILNLRQSKEDVLSKSKFSLQDTFISKLLRGEINTVEEFVGESESLNMGQWQKYLRVFILFYETENNSEKKSSIALIKQILSDSFLTHWVNTIDNSIIFIISSVSPMEEVLHEKLAEINLSALKDLEMKLSICVGNAFENPIDANRSYNEALIASKYRIVSNSGCIIFYNEIACSNKEGFIYPRIELNALNNAITTGDASRTKIIITDLINIVSKENKSLFVNVCLCYDVINCILKASAECGIEILNMNQNYLNSRLNMRLDSIKNLVETIVRLENLLYNHLISQAKPNELCFEAKIKKIVLNSYTNPEFSVQIIADQMGLNLSTLSRKFKNQTGKNLLDLITSARLEKAKELLTTTDKPVMEITCSVGYLSPNSFIIKFRQATGMTPVEYRNAYKNNKLSSPI